MADALFTSLFNNYSITAAGSAINHTLDATNDGWAQVFQSFITDPITHLGFRYGARTGTPPTYIIGLEGVATATGFPDGTYLGGGTPASSTFTPPADATWDGLWKWEALDNAYTPTRGELMAMTIRYSSGTVDASNLSTFTRTISGGVAVNHFPYHLTLTGGTWSRSALAAFGYRTASGRYGIIGQAAYSTTDSTSGNRSAMHFTLPSGHGNTFTVAGAAVVFRTPAASGSFKFGLWDSAGTMIQEVTLDSDQFSANGTFSNGYLMFDEASLTALDFGTKYYIGFESVSSSVIGIGGMTLAEADDRGAFPNGTNRGLATWNGATWTDTDTVMPFCSLICGDITEPAAGGGSGGLCMVIGG